MNIFPRSAAAICCLVIAACASATEDSSRGTASAGTCHADRVEWAVGQPATQEVMGRVWKESGSGLIRPIAPDQAVPGNHRPDRINVYIDADNIITRITCG